MLPWRDPRSQPDGAATSVTQPTRAGRFVRRLRHTLARDQRGFSMVEVVIALVLFEIVGAAMIGLLTSTTAAAKIARQRTVAQQAALNQIESIRSMSYDSVGIVNGNPPGSIAADASINQGGLVATLTTTVSFVNDPGPLSYTSYANYKKVVVTVKRTSDSRQLAQEVTYVAPPVKASATNAVVNATVVDYGNNTPIENAPVALSTGPSAPRSDTTDASGEVTFAGLTPNPTSGPQAYYDLAVTPPSGYVTLYDTVSPAAPAHVQLSPSQTWPTVLYVYLPSTIYVDLRNTDGTPFTGSTTVTVSYTRNSTPYSQQFSYTGSPLSITSITEGTTDVPLVPGLAYTVSASGGGVSSSPVTANVPDAYPTTLTHTFTATVTPVQAGTVNVSVVRQYYGTLCQNALVAVTGGPGPVSLSGYTSGTGGPAVFSNVPVGSGYTIASLGQSLTNRTVVSGTNPFTVTIPWWQSC